MDGKRTLARLGLIAGLVGLEVLVARDLGSSSGVLGYTQTTSHTVAPPRRARVRTLEVQLGDRVTAGQDIAVLDPTEVDNEIEVAKAAQARALAALEAETSKLRRAGVDSARKFDSSVERAATELATADASAKSATAELAVVETQLAEQRALVDKRLAEAGQLKALELRRAALANQVASSAKVLAMLRDNVGAASKRAALVGDDSESSLAPLRAEVDAAELHLRQLERERHALTLHAPVDGVIEQLPLHAGDLAAPDVPVATVVAADTTRVVACVPEARASTIEVGQEAELTTVFDRVSGTGVVESVTSEIAPLPARCQGSSSRPVVGRIAVVALDEATGKLPGETQIVRFQARRRQPLPRTKSPASSRELGPVDLVVPKALSQRTRFEPSGLVWVPALDRFVIASDDTGFEGRDEHAPWLFTMTARGAVDPAPLVIEGIDKLSDLEGLTLATDGALWAMCSSSTSKKGKRPAAREKLVRIELRRGKAVATGSVELASLLDRASADLRTSLGLASTRELDLEGIASRDGALYLGLKAPVDARDRALIWKVASPDQLLAGDLPGAGISVYARLGLTVEADGRTVPAGISDLAFAGTSLLVGATASGIDPARQSGALYVVPLDTLAATRVKTFADLKPEGIAISSDPTKIAIAFDRGSDAPQWLELPIAEARGR